MSLSGGRHPGELFTFIISGGIGGSDSRSFNYRNTVTAMDMPNTRILKECFPDFLGITLPSEFCNF